MEFILICSLIANFFFAAPIVKNYYLNLVKKIVDMKEHRISDGIPPGFVQI